MAKKIVKKKKLKILPFFIMLVILALIFLGVELYLNTPIKNITILKTNYLTDEYIMKEAGIEDYPSFWHTSSWSVKKKLKKSPYIKDVKVKKGFYHTITITVSEHEPLFFDSLKNKYVLDNGQAIESDVDLLVPRLTNEVPPKTYKKLVTKMKTIKPTILVKVSEISYTPNQYDKDRFLLFMDDDNSVYLTLTKFKKMNYYNDVLAQLEGKKGILYLDSGNHFKIMK